MAQKAHMDMGGVLRVLEHIPLANEQEQHLRSRRELSRLNNATYTSRLERLSAALLDRESIFRRSGIVDITRDFFHPIIDAITLPEPSMQLERRWPGPSQIFDRFLSLNRRRTVYQTINELYIAAEARQLESMDALIALRILGYDALLGSVEASFLQVVRSHPGIPMNQMQWPQSMSATAVPTVERIAGVDLVLDGHRIEKGDRLRLFLATDSADTDLFFGAGRHKCVGAGISQKIWLAFVETLSRQTCTIDVIDVLYPTSDFVFNCPQTINIRITPI